MPCSTQHPVLFSIPKRLNLPCRPCLENCIKGGCQVCQLLPLANLCCILSYSLFVSLCSDFAILLSTFPTVDFFPEAFCASQVRWSTEGEELLTSSPGFKCSWCQSGWWAVMLPDLRYFFEASRNNLWLPVLLFLHNMSWCFNMTASSSFVFLLLQLSKIFSFWTIPPLPTGLPTCFYQKKQSLVYESSLQVWFFFFKFLLLLYRAEAFPFGFF